ncbi:MAG: hypothetical protein ACRDA4_00985 [Filifactoraceae bacterium]
MIKSKNKIYIGSSQEGYLNEEMMSSIFEYLATHEIIEPSKAKPRKIGESYLLEIEVNDHTKQLIKNLKSMRKIRLYKRTHTWEEIYKMCDQTVKSS